MPPNSQRSSPKPPAASAPPFMGRGGPGHGHMGSTERAEDVRATVQRLWVNLRRQKGALIVVTLMVVATTGLQLLGPYLLVQLQTSRSVK